MSGDREPGKGSAALEIKDLIVRYGKGEDVLRGISLELKRHEIIGLIGASGSGKSTLLRAVHRLVEPAAGAVILEGVNLSGLAAGDLRQARLRMGMIFQEHALVGRLTVMENVLCGTLGRTGFWKSVRRHFDPDDVNEAFRLLERMSLEGLEDRRCDELSGGQKQRVGIARALIQHPDVLLVDEPTASLDPAASARIMSLITEVCTEDGLSAIINLHDVPLARRFCPRILGLHEGRIVFDGPPSALNDEILTQVYGEEALESYVGAGSDGPPVGD